MSELKFKMGTKSSVTPTSGNIGEVFFTTDENKYGHIYFVDKMKKIINIVPKLLEVKFGGTGKTTHTSNSVLVGNETNAIKNIQSLDGAFYATGTNDEPQFGTLPVEQGGTGSTSQTANRIIYTSNASTIASSGHYASSNKIAINSTTAPSGAFHVNGISTFAAPSNGHGHLYFTGAVANSSTSNKTQLVFGTSSDNHLAISSDTKALVLNPTTVSTSNQIVLYLEQASLFPGGISITTVTNADGTVTKGNLSVAGNTTVGGAISAGSHLSAEGDLTVSGNGSIDGDFTVDGEGTIKNSLIVENGAVISGRAYNSGDDEGIVVLPAENSYAGITLGDASGIRTTLYLLPSGDTHRSVWRHNNGVGTYNITHPETDGEIVVHTADTAQGSETLPVYIDENGVVTPCTASSVFSDFSSEPDASGETLSITVAGQTRTVTLDAANASQGGVITTGTQTIAGQKTFNGTIYSSKIVPRSDMNSNYTLGDTSNTWYNIYSRYLTLYDGTNGYDGGRIYTTVSADTTAQSTLAQLGNSTATGTAGNRYGILRLYSEGSTYLSLVAHRYATNSTSTAATSRTIYLRDHGNTAYLVATTTRNAVGSGTKPVYVSTSGVITPSSSTLGATDTPIYMSSGELKACSSSKGSASVPVYMSSGKILQCTASSIFSSFTSSTNTLSITVCGETRTVKSVVKSVSNTWTGGTTDGPTLKTTVNGVAGTAVAIPSASSSASGIVTTGAQTFAGTKTFNGGIVIATNKQIKCADTGGSHILGRDNATVRNTTSIQSSSWSPIISSKTHLGSWEAGVCHATTSAATGEAERFAFNYALDTNYSAGTNTTTCALQLIPDGTAYSAKLATGNTGTANPSGTPIVGTLYFKQI